nr:hypothetical protein [Aliiroseovarius subalbicans]
MRRFLGPVLLLLTLAGCAGDNEWASDDLVARARYVHDGPPMITLFTVINNKSDGGAHSALMINGSQRVLFDPAGTWHHPHLPERHDVHYGITDPAVYFYIDYHSRVTYRTIRQDLVVSPEVAEMALRMVQENGSVNKAMCTTTVSRMLRQLPVPGFETLPQTLWPNKLSDAFRELPGVVEEVTYDDDPEENGYILARGIAPL